MTTLVLSFSVSLPMDAASATAFSLDFALLSTPVPEPSLALLALVAALLLVALRSGVTLRVTRPRA